MKKLFPSSFNQLIEPSGIDIGEAKKILEQNVQCAQSGLLASFDNNTTLNEMVLSIVLSRAEMTNE